MNQLTETAPREIWLQANLEDESVDVDFPCEEDRGECVTWCSSSVGGAEVKYVRADVADCLLNALELCMNAVCLAGWGDDYCMDEARAAIAKHKGK